MGSDRIAVTIEGGVAHVELARPGKFNAMDKDMFAAIGDTFRALGRDGAVRAILLSGQGRHFTAGLDLAIVSDGGSTAGVCNVFVEYVEDPFDEVDGIELTRIS